MVEEKSYVGFLFPYLSFNYSSFETCNILPDINFYIIGLLQLVVKTVQFFIFE